MLTPAFQLRLNNAVLHRLATVGRCAPPQAAPAGPGPPPDPARTPDKADDGEHACLTCATSAGKVLIHHPHELDENGQHVVRFVNIDRQVTALEAGRLEVGEEPEPADEAAAADQDQDQDAGEGGQEEGKQREGRSKRRQQPDTLYVGTQTNLMAFDVERNADRFYVDVPDGVNAMILGSLPGVSCPMAIVGGNCSLQGFDARGTEQYWTVTGGNVTALSFCDVEEDGKNELLVGSEDLEIRIFQREEVVVEVVETDVITGLAPVHHTRFAYSLANGTVGVYARASRVWRVKSKHQPMAVGTFDLDADGVPEVVTGWSSGKLDVRKEDTGDVLFKDAFHSKLSAIVQADYRGDGTEEIICCALDGEVRGYRPINPEMAQSQAAADASRQQAASAVKELLAQKAELELQLRGVEENLKQYKAGGLAPSAMPPDTQVSVASQVNASDRCVELVVSTNNSTVVRSVIVMCLDSGVFAGESVMFAPSTPASRVVCPLRPESNTASELQVKVLVAARGTTAQYHVFELSHQLVKFAMFTPVDPRMVVQPSSNVEFQVAERVNRLLLWLQRSFYVTEADVSRGEDGADSLLAAFRPLRGGSADADAPPLVLRMTQEGGGQVSVMTNDMDLAAEIVQDLAAYWQVTELESAAHFPAEMEAFEAVLRRVDDFNATRLQLTAEMADQSHRVKTLVIRAEDARIIGDMPLMRRMYADLFTLNNQLIGEYSKRSGNHQALLAALKDVNKMIQKASHLRVGHARTRVVSACRNAIKTNNINALFQIIRHGRETH